MKKIYLFHLLLAFLSTNGNAQNQSLADHWVATDALGRTLPTNAQTGDLKANKTVGVFYYIWHGHHGNKVYDITKILKGQGSYGPENQFHFWGEPEYGYYRSEDPWVIRRDLQMFSNAKVDFIFFDATNAVTYLPTVNKICEISRQMRLEGIKTPQICFMTKTRSGEIMNQLYNDFYSKNSYSDLWFRWQGKPLVLGDFNDPVLQQNVRNFFTIKYSWAVTDTKNQPNHWQWLDWTPQDYGWSTDRNVPEQITVTTAFHPENPHGQSYMNGQQPPVNSQYLTAFTGQGRYAQEQWNVALNVSPPLVMVTQWNEWLAQRFFWSKGDGMYAGRPVKNGDNFFVDVLSEEFNRDMAPMKGGHTDNMYYQLISNVRKYKGMAEPQPMVTPATIAIDGDFAQWKNILPVHWDPRGDVMHRNHASYDPSVTLVNNTGRNDILESRATQDVDNVYFYAKTASPITPFSEPGWMLLFINADENKSTGWEGYDYIINYGVNSATETTVNTWNGSAWVKTGTCSYKVTNNEIELKLAKSQVGLTGKNQFLFKWSDNPQYLTDISGIFLNGDAAPDRRFDYQFKSAAVIAQSPYPGTPHKIPGTIEAEDYDKGGETVSFHDEEATNLGSTYRTDGVDIEVCSEGGHNIGWSNTGEWLEYTVQVASSGAYLAEIRVASPVGGTFHLEIDGNNVSGILTVPNTGDWQAWTTVSKNINLTAGQHVLRYYIDQKAFNINKFVFSPVTITSLEEASASIGVKLYPNPAKDQVTIQTGELVFEKLSIVNVEGKVVWEENGSFVGNKNISLENLPSGKYSLHLKSSNLNVKRNLIIR